MFSLAKLRRTDDTAPAATVREQHSRKRGNAGGIGFVPELESLRGIAALLVASYHASNPYTASNIVLWIDPRSWTNPMWSGPFWLDRAVSNGLGAVNVFFVLSGFVLASSIQRGPQGVGPAAGHFFIARIFRLFPAIISTVLLFCIAYWLTGAAIPNNAPEIYRPISIIRNMLLIDWNIDGVMWSLQVEALAIPLIFVLTLGQQRLGLKFAVVIGTLLLVLATYKRQRDLVAHGAFLAYFYAFAFGIGTHLTGPWLSRWLGRIGLPLVLTAVLALFCVPHMFLGFFSRWARFAECVSAVAVIAILVYGSGGSLKRVLNWPVFRFYGRISYSFYLLHPLSFLVIWKIPGPLSRLLDAGVPAIVIALVLTISSILAVTPLAWLSWRFVEIPGIAAGRRLSPERRNASPYVGAHGRIVHETGMVS